MSSLTLDYEPINQKQLEFHQSKARHKLLIGGVGAGKTHPACHEAYLICIDNPGHEFGVFRNTWDSLKDNVLKDMLRIGYANNLIYDFDKQKCDIILKNGVTVRCRPLSLQQDQIKGMHLCGMLIDDPNVWKYRKVISFLYTRLRNPPHVKANYFRSIICANWEGKNFLWQTYMRDREQGPKGDDGTFAWWLCPTNENPTLEDSYIPDLEKMHNKRWMNRYVYCDLDQVDSGLIYDEFNPKLHLHDLSFLKKKSNNPKLIKIMAVDVGLEATVVLKMACDGKRVYVYDEWYQDRANPDDLGNYLSYEVSKDNYKKIIIDPSSAKGEQLAKGDNMMSYLKTNFGLYMIEGGTNAIDYGIETVRSLIAIRKTNDDKLTTCLVFDEKNVPNTLREIEVYRYSDEGLSELDDIVYKPKPIDYDDHCMDCMKYGSVYLQPFLVNFGHKLALMKQQKKQLWKDRVNKLRLYKEKPGLFKKHKYRNAKKLRELHYGKPKKKKRKVKRITSYF
jgi:hypothetical protein